MPTNSSNSRRLQTCTDPVIGAILTGWRYDISQIPADLRVDYEAHLAECSFCRSKQRLNRTVDALLLSATTLSFVAFLLAALVLRRVEAVRHLASLHVKLHPETAGLFARLPSTVTIGLEAVAIAGVVLSLLLWGLVAMTTPMGGMVSAALRQRMRSENGNDDDVEHAA
ncbi:MAG: hypothetical protein PW792_05570 [Acidobacteriaceae bacterium]|nr:hypothetical protein [Acidobacteriaceae bacterium]